MSVEFALALALFVGHVLGDHVCQSDHQARNKQRPGAVGAKALAGHITGYTIAQAMLIAVVAAVSDAPITLTGAAIALVISASTHAVIDRGRLLAHIARWTRTSGYHATPTGRANQDQALHMAALFVAIFLGGGFG